MKRRKKTKGGSYKHKKNPEKCYKAEREEEEEKRGRIFSNNH